MYNATSARNTYGTLLYVGQASDGEHRVEVKNMVDGKLLALDYFVATSSASGGEKWDTAPVNPVPTSGPGPTATHSIPGGSAPAPSSAFPNGAGSATSEGESNNSAVIGGILGTLGGIVSHTDGLLLDDNKVDNSLSVAVTVLNLAVSSVQKSGRRGQLLCRYLRTFQKACPDGRYGQERL